MNENKIDYDLKKQFEKKQIEIPELIKQRIHYTLENLPERKRSILNFSTIKFKYVLGSIVCLMLAFVTIIPFISNQFRLGNHYAIPDDMTTVQNPSETFTTVMPKSWKTIEFGDERNRMINIVPPDQSVSITVSEGVYYITTGVGERNILMENFEASDSYKDFIDKMVNYHSHNGSRNIEEIDKVDNIPIFMEKIEDNIMLIAYSVVDKKPFAIFMQSGHINTVEKLKEEGYYQYFKQAIQLTHPN
ncbi:hypothetical protein K0H71_22245 [Bacillus sp. IITD106]|nr:hypothetical protein [Bacillus sp. IITD106]